MPFNFNFGRFLRPPVAQQPRAAQPMGGLGLGGFAQRPAMQPKFNPGVARPPAMPPFTGGRPAVDPGFGINTRGFGLSAPAMPPFANGRLGITPDFGIVPGSPNGSPFTPPATYTPTPGFNDPNAPIRTPPSTFYDQMQIPGLNGPGGMPAQFGNSLAGIIGQMPMQPYSPTTGYGGPNGVMPMQPYSPTTGYGGPNGAVPQGGSGFPQFMPPPANPNQPLGPTVQPMSGLGSLAAGYGGPNNVMPQGGSGFPQFMQGDPNQLNANAPNMTGMNSFAGQMQSAGTSAAPSAPPPPVPGGLASVPNAGANAAV